VIPFNPSLYFKVLAVVTIVILLVFAGAIIIADYEVTSADPIGAPIAIILLAYFFHLALWNPSK